MTSTEQLQAQCNRIANDIENKLTYEQAELIHLAEDNGLEPTDPISAMDYLHDSLDIELTYSYSTKSYSGSSIAVSIGGPNIFIQTNASNYVTIIGRWGSDKYEVSATDNLGIDDYMNELYDMDKESK